MKSKKTTRRALLTSMLSLLICVSMLVGSTFAWFTDSVTSKNNIIKSGNLDVELYYQVEGQTDWTKVTEKTNIFKEGALWEPGHTEVVKLKIVNEGTLAFNYSFGINVVSETGSVNKDGKEFKLSDYIYFGLVDGVQNYNRDQAVEAVKNGAQPIAKGYSKHATMDPAKQQTVQELTLVVYMPTTVGNEANHAKDAAVPTINLGLTVLATQLTAESDSFDNQYDKDAYVLIDPTKDLRTQIESAPEGSIVVIPSGDYTLNSMIVIEGKSLTIVGAGEVNIKMTAAQHMFTIQDSNDPESDMVVNISNINLDGGNVARHGFNVKYNVTANLTNVTVKNTTWASLLLDNGNAYNDGSYHDGTDTVVNVAGSELESAAMNALPCSTTSTAHNTYAHLNFDGESSIGSIEKQSVCQNHGNLFINESNADPAYVLYATNDADLAQVLNQIKTQSKFWNKSVTVKLLPNEYSADHVVYQYPEWNGVVGAGSTANNMSTLSGTENVTHITFVGEHGVKFTGNVTVNGFGNAGTGFGNAKATTTFKGMTFNGANSVEENGKDYIVVYAKAAANDVTFDGCLFEGATHVTLGGSGADAVGKVTVKDCTFNDGGCLSGYYETLDVSGTTVTAAKKGFINKAKAGNVTVTNSTITAGEYFLRTANSGIHVTVTDSTIALYEVDGAANLVNFRGSSESATFVDCNVPASYGTKGVDADSVLTVNGVGSVVVAVKTAAELQAALSPTVSGDTATVVLTDDIQLAVGESWTPLDLKAYADSVKNIVINGNGHTISGLNAPLIGHAYFGNTSIEIKNLTLSDVTIENKGYNGLGSGAFVAYADNCDHVVIENCHLEDSTITATVDFTGIGGIVGYSSSNLIIKDCSVTNTTINGSNQSAGAIAGHVSAGHSTTITNAKVVGCTVKGERADKSGYVIGTANNGDTTITTHAECANNTVFDVANSTTIYGRLVGGTLTVNGVAQ